MRGCEVPRLWMRGMLCGVVCLLFLVLPVGGQTLCDGLDEDGVGSWEPRRRHRVQISICAERIEALRGNRRCALMRRGRGGPLL